MATDFGLSFVPGQAQGQSANGPTPGGTPPTPIQTAIKLLSLRLPRVGGANAIAPQSLLQGAGGAALPPTGMGAGSTSIGPPAAGAGQGGASPLSLEELLKQLFGSLGGTTPTNVPALPTPRVTPGFFPPPPPDAGFAPAPVGPPDVDRSSPPTGNRPPGDVLSGGPFSDFERPNQTDALTRLGRFRTS